MHKRHKSIKKTVKVEVTIHCPDLLQKKNSSSNYNLPLTWNQTRDTDWCLESLEDFPNKVHRCEGKPFIYN